MEQTLLLNTTYEPITIISWQRAITLVYLGKSEVLEEYNREIRCTSTQIKIPAVVRMRERVRSVKPVVRFSRQNVYLRDNFRCQYCGSEFKAAELTYDHVQPRSKGGPTNWTNIVSCCVKCNRRKGSLTPEQAGMRLLKKPSRPAALPYRGVTTNQNPPSAWKFYLWNNGQGHDDHMLTFDESILESILSESL
jgi:5-methylcytosine-specific restriction endonuclease McrA